MSEFWGTYQFDENEKEQDKFYFIQAKATDNPYLPETYYTTLESLPDQLKRAFLDGDWDLFKGQYFREWRKDIHVVEPFQIPDSWKRIVTIDYGFAKPSAAYWCAISPESNFYVYRELYAEGMTYSVLTDRIIAMTPDDEQIRYWIADPSIWSKKGETELSGAEIMQNRYRELKRQALLLLQGNNDRINGWRIIREYLKPFMKDDKKMARLQVFKNCYDFIRTFPALVHDNIKIEDLNSDGEDHAADAIRYGIMSNPSPARTPLELKQIQFNRHMREKKAREKRERMRNSPYFRRMC